MWVIPIRRHCTNPAHPKHATTSVHKYTLTAVNVVTGTVRYTLVYTPFSHTQNVTNRVAVRESTRVLSTSLELLSEVMQELPDLQPAIDYIDALDAALAAAEGVCVCV